MKSVYYVFIVVSFAGLVITFAEISLPASEAPPATLALYFVLFSSIAIIFSLKDFVFSERKEGEKTGSAGSRIEELEKMIHKAAEGDSESRKMLYSILQNAYVDLKGEAASLDKRILLQQDVPRVRRVLKKVGRRRYLEAFQEAEDMVLS